MQPWCANEAKQHWCVCTQAISSSTSSPPGCRYGTSVGAVQPAAVRASDVGCAPRSNAEQAREPAATEWEGAPEADPAPCMVSSALASKNLARQPPRIGKRVCIKTERIAAAVATARACSARMSRRSILCCRSHGTHACRRAESAAKQAASVAHIALGNARTGMRGRRIATLPRLAAVARLAAIALFKAARTAALASCPVAAGAHEARRHPAHALPHAATAGGRLHGHLYLAAFSETADGAARACGAASGAADCATSIQAGGHLELFTSPCQLASARR